MSDEDARARRVRFYGVNDMATGWYVPRVAELVEQFNPMDVSTNTEDILELHNVQQYLEHGFFPNAYNEEARKQAVARIPQIRTAVARHFSAIENADFAAAVAGVDHEYHADLLDLLGRNKAFERCDSATVLPALINEGVHLGELLASKKLVQAYDTEMRDALRAAPRGAEHLIRRYLEDDVRGEVHLPASLTPVDARELLERYIDSDEANPNYVGLIAVAKENPRAGIDAKLKLRAKRRKAEMTATFFAGTKGFKTGCEVRLSDTQEDPVVFEMDTSEGMISRYTYSSRWLEATCDNPSILNNFLHLFEFVDYQALLVLPSYPAHLGVMERFIGTTGKNQYKVGVAFHSIDMRTLLQTRRYHDFLDSKDIDLEQVIMWFFKEYLVEEFGASNFSFTPSGRGTPYLQKVRHLFAEMESVANQFVLFVKDHELDRDLLAMASEQVRYKEIPSLLEGKYVYPAEDGDVVGILHLLFSDQSALHYINENLKADSAALLLLENHVAYDDFEGYQKPSIDFLVEQGVLENTGTRIQIGNFERFRILSALFTTQAASFYHLSEAGRAEAETMIAKGWVTRRSSLLTDAEGNYFNYFLNAVDFSNGPQLRNKYLHGSQSNVDSEDAHFETYIIALRLILALVIKINDDFCLAASEGKLEGASL
ncbi:hypothetical protein [Mycetocola sp.]|uniref:hypothetical protein n=1 Tax=Mycetocola sp. TaxID=1871042 RepID=UPI003988BF2D